MGTAVFLGELAGDGAQEHLLCSSGGLSFRVISTSVNQMGQPETIHVCHSKMIQTVLLTQYERFSDDVSVMLIHMDEGWSSGPERIVRRQVLTVLVVKKCLQCAFHSGLFGSRVTDLVT